MYEKGLFITDFTEKAQLFNDYFILQYTTIDTGSNIPPAVQGNPILLSDFVISEEKILKIIRSLNPNKAHGWDEISIRMIKFSDVSLVTPLKIIFTNCLSQGVFPGIWKCANVVPVHKKNEKNLKSNYRPISLLPIFGKVLEKLMYDSLYSHLDSCDLLNPNQSGFRRGTSREKLYTELDWESLSFRRWSRCLTLFYKILNNLTLLYTKEPIPTLHQSNYSLRHQDSVGRMRARTEKFKSSFYPVCITEWNKLDPEIRLAPSVAIFKTKLQSIIRPPANRSSVFITQ